MEVFGLGRIYDRKAGRDPTEGRTADYLLCLVLYAGPVFGGALLLDHFAAFEAFSNVPDIRFLNLLLSGQGLAQIPSVATQSAQSIQHVAIIVSMFLFILYVIIEHRSWNRGYTPPIAKIALFGTTAVSYIFAWGFNSFAMGYLIAKTFHAVQYFALVWVLDAESIKRALGSEKVLSLSLFLVMPICLSFLLIAYYSDEAKVFLVVCTIMHFWSDGFVWSTRETMGFRERSP